MIFKGIILDNWNQFAHVEMAFNQRLTVITGANGAGKSTLLRLISKLIGWNYQEIATPSRKIGYYSFGRRLKSMSQNIQQRDNQIEDAIGKISLSDGKEISVFLPTLASDASYNVSLSPHMYLKGISIPSHRTAYSYRKIDSIPVKAHTKNEAYSFFSETLKNSYFGHYNSEPPSQKMKASLISLALFGRGNEYVQQDDVAMKLFQGFIEILKILLPPTLGFKGIIVRNGEVILETASGDFLLDAVSGGIGSIFDLAWQIYMFESDKNEPFFVLIDEAENHLHASMQRSLLPNLLLSFPNAQFIVTTHSPLMVNSVKNSTVYALKYNDENLVISELLDFHNKSANASQILREVLGVPVTMPIWVEESLNLLLDKYRGNELTPESYTSLKEDLKGIGLSDHLPQALSLLQEGGLT